MAKLSKDSAEKYYEKIIAIHYFHHLTLAQKVSIFFHDLEHDILKEITGKKGYFEQLNWLKDNQIRFEHNIQRGNIPKVNIGDIENIKNWRNEGIHEAKMPEPKYRSHFHTMAETISFFSEIPIPLNIINIFNNNEKENVKKINKDKPKNKDNNILDKDESMKIINKKFSLKLNDRNCAYSSINSSVSNSQWSFNIDNAKFNMNYYIILEDQEDKILYLFYIGKGTISIPKNIFNQRKRSGKMLSIIIIKKNSNKIFSNNFNNTEFKFNKYLIGEVKYNKNANVA